jgi:hypothetical protein
MEFVQAILSALGGFFSGIGELFGLWMASTDDAPVIVKWFAFAVALTIGLALAPRLMDQLLLAFDQDRTRPVSVLLTSRPVRLIVVAGVAILLAATAAALVGTVLTAPP